MNKPVQKPTKGIAPSVDGVPGSLVTEPDGLVWGGSGRQSPYDPLIYKLIAATEEWDKAGKPGKRPVLQFRDIKAKPSLYSRSKRMSVTLAYTETPDGLFVKFMHRNETPVSERRRSLILKILKSGPQSHIHVASKIRSEDDPNVDAQMVDAILVQMLRENKVVRQEGGTWRLK